VEIPIIILPLSNQFGLFALEWECLLNYPAEAATADEAQASLQRLFEEKLQSGAEVRSLKWPIAVSSAGWLPDDELTARVVCRTFKITVPNAMRTIAKNSKSLSITRPPGKRHELVRL